MLDLQPMETDELDQLGVSEGYTTTFDIGLDLSDMSVGASDNASGGGMGGPGGGRPSVGNGRP